MLRFFSCWLSILFTLKKLFEIEGIIAVWWVFNHAVLRVLFLVNLFGELCSVAPTALLFIISALS